VGVGVWGEGGGLPSGRVPGVAYGPLLRQACAGPGPHALGLPPGDAAPAHRRARGLRGVRPPGPTARPPTAHTHAYARASTHAGAPLPAACQARAGLPWCCKFDWCNWQFNSLTNCSLLFKLINLSKSWVECTRPRARARGISGACRPRQALILGLNTKHFSQHLKWRFPYPKLLLPLLLVMQQLLLLLLPLLALLPLLLLLLLVLGRLQATHHTHLWHPWLLASC